MTDENKLIEEGTENQSKTVKKITRREFLKGVGKVAAGAGLLAVGGSSLPACNPTPQPPNPEDVQRTVAAVDTAQAKQKESEKTQEVKYTFSASIRPVDSNQYVDLFSESESNQFIDSMGNLVDFKSKIVKGETFSAAEITVANGEKSEDATLLSLPEVVDQQGETVIPAIFLLKINDKWTELNSAKGEMKDDEGNVIDATVWYYISPEDKKTGYAFFLYPASGTPEEKANNLRVIPPAEFELGYISTDTPPKLEIGSTGAGALFSPVQYRTETPVVPTETKEAVTEEPKEPTKEPTPEATKEAMSDKESKFYKPEVVAPVSLEVDGVTLNWHIGLMFDVLEAGIKDLKIHQGTKEYDDQWQYLGRILLKMGWKNYKAYSNSGISYENYCKLVNKGEGKIKIGGVDEATASYSDKRNYVEVSPQDLTLLLSSGVRFPLFYASPFTGYVAKGQEGNLILGDNGLMTLSRRLQDASDESSEEKSKDISFFVMREICEPLFALGMSSDSGYNAEFISGGFTGNHQYDTTPYSNELDFDTWWFSFLSQDKSQIIKSLAIEVVLAS